MVLKKMIRGTKSENDFNRALQLRDSNDLKGAIKILKKLIKEFPGDKFPFVMLGGIYFDQLNDPKKGEHYFQKVIELEPNFELGSIGLFHALNNQNKGYEALTEMKRYLKNNKNSRRYAELIKEIEEGYEKKKVGKFKTVNHYTSAKKIEKVEKLINSKWAKKKGFSKVLL